MSLNDKIALAAIPCGKIPPVFRDRFKPARGTHFKIEYYGQRNEKVHRNQRGFCKANEFG